ncbi:MAG: SusC/RagA family TonB-linked outer membrane protein [Candidatus Pseudobacter hemicellulosilyticus]|uniref:SusC/RagA family TonB-linked outer membrane protein n=1 Tax=Candidatus Pseudobacter hemicellulosilyticus TaxID=3121375 RepID=A0AAJ5WS53_9BACT|nr:MAG: SusC/RagA family TonB-linked outer membrane protein [Pseudobacter sp.]
MKFFIDHKEYGLGLINNRRCLQKGLLVTSLLIGTLWASAQHTDSIPQTDTTVVMVKPQRVSLYFKEKPKNNLTESLVVVKGDDLKKTPLSSIANALAGRVAGLNVTQNNGEPGNYGTSFTLRDRVPLVLVDGVPRDMNSILTEHVESITVLKDAIATAPLGARGAPGVILVTTRKQNDQPGFNVDFTANYGIAQPLKIREQVSAAQYAELYNEALANDSRPLKYSQADIDAYTNKTNPYLYPENDWKKQLVENSAPFSRYVLNAAGSSSMVNYFLSADYMTQDGLLKQGSSSYSTNADYQRFGLRGNVAVAITPRTTLSLNLYGAIQRRTVPGESPSFGFGNNTNRLTISSPSLNNIFNGIINVPRNAYPLLNPNGSLGGNQFYQGNLWGQSTLSGYSQTNMSDGMADLKLRRDLSDVLKGWWVQGTASYTSQIIHTLVRTKSFAAYEMNVSAAGDTSYRQFGTIGEQSNNRVLNIRNGNFFFDLATGISRNWGKHALDASLQYQYSSSTLGGQLPFRVSSGIATLTYAYDNRYIVDLVTSYSGHNWYRKGDRFDFYPAAGFSWNVHNEAFFGRNNLLSSLKLKASYGLTGFLFSNYYSYMYTYSNYANAYYFGATPGGVQGVTENQIPYARTTEKTLKLNLGVDWGMFRDRASFSVQYYRDRAYDLMQVRGYNTALLGAPYPDENLGKTIYTGVEATAGWQDKAGSVSYFINGNIAFQKNKILFNDQPVQPYPWMGSQGNSINQVYGYIADGFVTGAGQGPVVEGYRSVPGDLKYKDLNGDGVINFYDRTAIAPDRPQLFFGINAGVSYKGFDLNVLVSGVSNRTVNLTGTGEWEFQNSGLASVYPHHLGRWTPETAATATYPRLTVGTNVNNHVNSTFWLRSANFLRLKTVELGYNFSGRLMAKAGIKGLRAFVSGFNLLTISGGEDRFDPETLSYGYPIQRIINGGVSIKL